MFRDLAVPHFRPVPFRTLDHSSVPFRSAPFREIVTTLSFATQHHLTFNPDKTQLIKFCKCADATSPRFTFLGQSLCLRNSVTHLGHILTHNLSDSEDISSISKDMCRKANCMLHLFACCDPFIKTRLFQAFVFHCMVQLSGNLLIPS